MTTWIKVARFHLVDRLSFTALPWGILTLVVGVNLAVAASIGAGGTIQVQTGGLAALYVFFVVLGVLSIGQSLPFALALGVSRRSYFAGTVLLAVSLAAGYGLALSVLQVIEQASSGWGVGLHFFRVAYILPGPWYLTWLTSFVGLTLMFIYGMWHGLIYRRWNVPGLLAVATSEVVVLAAGVVIISDMHAWSATGQFFTTLSAAGLTGLLAGLTAALLAGGYATMRRVTV